MRGCDALRAEPFVVAAMGDRATVACLGDSRVNDYWRESHLRPYEGRSSCLAIN
jgi:hypothetical protein